MPGECPLCWSLCSASHGCVLQKSRTLRILESGKEGRSYRCCGSGAGNGEAGVPEDRPLSFSPGLFLTCLHEMMYSNGAAFKTVLKGSPQELRHLEPPQSSCAAAVRCVLPSFGFYAVVTKDAPYSPFSVTCPLLSNSAMRCGVQGPVLASAQCRGHRISPELDRGREGSLC